MSNGMEMHHNKIQKFDLSRGGILDVFTKNDPEEFKKKYLLTTTLRSHYIAAIISISYEDNSYLSVMTSFNRLKKDTHLKKIFDYLLDLNEEIDLPIKSSKLDVFIPTNHTKEEEDGNFRAFLSPDDMTVYNQIHNVYAHIYPINNASSSHACYCHKTWKPTINILHLTPNKHHWIDYKKN